MFSRPGIYSPGGLKLRARDPESFSVFSDSQLYKASGIGRLSSKRERSYLLVELLVRRWLYKGVESAEIDLTIEKLSEELGAGVLVQKFHLSLSESKNITSSKQ